MKLKKLDLPKKYKYIEGESRPEYKKYHGRNKLSYSQYSSFKDIEEDGYKGKYLAQYFMGIPDPGNVFSDFGGYCGEYIELGEDKSLQLSEKDKEILDSIERPKDTEYEKEIVIDMANYGYDFVVQGFIDERFKKEGIYIIDTKTANIDKKTEYYASKDYGQTTLYCIAEELEGNEIEYSGVRLFGRKGNGLEKYPLYLTGAVKEIPTPYSKERAEKLIEDICKTATEISDYYKVYNKYFKT